MICNNKQIIIEISNNKKYLIKIISIIVTDFNNLYSTIIITINIQIINNDHDNGNISWEYFGGADVRPKFHCGFDYVKFI